MFIKRLLLSKSRIIGSSFEYNFVEKKDMNRFSKLTCEKFEHNFVKKKDMNSFFKANL